MMKDKIGRILSFKLVYPRAQLSIIVYILFSFFLPFLLMFYLLKLFLGERFQLFLMSLEPSLFNISIFSVVVMTLILYSLNLSTRLVGPIYRFKKELRFIRENDKLSKISFRKNDYYKDLEEEFNLFVDYISKKSGK